MSKLVDRERLAKLAKALDDRAKAAVAAERERALAAEAAIEAKADANAAAIEAINDVENGILAQAKADAKAQVEAEAALREQADGVLDGRIATLEGLVVGGEGEGLEKVIGDVTENKAAIEKLNGGVEEEGSVAKAVEDGVAPVRGRVDALEAEQDTQDAAIEAAQQAADKAQEEVDALELRVDALEGEMDAAEGRLDALEAEQDTQDAAIQAAQEAADQAQEEVDAVELRMDQAEQDIEAAEGRLDGVEGRLDVVEPKIQALEEYKDGVEPRVEALEGDMEVLKGEGEGSIKKQIADAIEPVQGEIDALEAVVGVKAEGENPATGMFDYIDKADAQVLADAKAHAEQKIADLVNAAPEELNTLKELADAIGAHQDVYDAYVATVSGDLDKKVDKVEGSRLITEEEAAAFAAKAEVGDVQQALQDAKDYADVEDAKIEAIIGQEANGEQAATGMMLRLANLEGKDGEIDGEIEGIKGRVQTLEGEMDNAEGRLDAVEGRLDVVEPKVQANGEAIEVLNGDGEGSVAKAIADALEPFSNTEEIKAMLGNIVNSLALTMEDNKMKLKLGGVEGITIHETALDMATDEDIDAIIAGLDVVEGE